MKLSITLQDKDKNEYKSIESFFIDNAIWNYWIDNSGVITNSETTGKTTWLEILKILKWIGDNGIEIKQPFYFPGKKITITKC